MPQLLTRKFRIDQARIFRDSVQNGGSANNIYTFVGRQVDWPGGTPDTPNNSVAYTDFDIWREMIALKKVQASDISLVIPEHEWTSGNVYQQYDHKHPDLIGTQFYVFTEDNNVYKCLYNNGGAGSTVKPEGQDTTAFQTSDGYVWKFMYNITPAVSNKFETANYIPVETLTANNGSAQWSVQQAAVNTSIEVITIDNAGSGYLQVINTVASVTNTSVLTLPLSASGVDNIYNGSTIYIKSGLGAGQLREVIDYTGSGRVVTVNNAFVTAPNTTSVFVISPKVTINGDGSGAQAYANTTGGALNFINMISTGQDYSTANVVISANVGSGGTANTIISPPNGHGFDPEEELGGHCLVLNTQFNADESNTINTINDFNLFGFIKNPVLAGSGNFATGPVYDTTIKLNITSVSAPFFATYIDEGVTGGSSGASAVIVHIANTNAANTAGVMHINELNKKFIAGETVTSNTSGITAVISSVEDPVIRHFSGDVLFVETRNSVQRNPLQTEDVKVVIKY